MPVFFRGTQRILFIHVPKAGGTSVESFFDKNGFLTAYLDRGESADSLNEVRRCSPQHMHAALLEALFDPALFDYVFMTVRHPVQRLLSKFVMETGETEDVARLEDWIYGQFSRVFGDPGYLDNHLRPQCDFLLPQARVYRLEDGLGESFVARLEVEAGVEFADKTLGREMHAGLGTPDFESLPPAAQDLVRRYYAQDFATFGYE